MNFLWRSVAFAVVMTMTLAAEPKTSDEIATRVLAPLLDSGKIATLKGDRPVNARLYRILGWLETARLAGGDLPDMIDAAQAGAGCYGTAQGLADRAALVRSWRQLNQFGCFTADGLAALKKGRSPRITKGRHTGDMIHLDHILPRSLVPELDARFHNLIPVPSQVNRRKGAKVGPRELALARRWCREALLSDQGLDALERARKITVTGVDPVATPLK